VRTDGRKPNQPPAVGQYRSDGTGQFRLSQASTATAIHSGASPQIT
jgi:hypothetical protein